MLSYPLTSPHTARRRNFPSACWRLCQQRYQSFRLVLNLSYCSFPRLQELGCGVVNYQHRYHSLPLHPSLMENTTVRVWEMLSYRRFKGVQVSCFSISKDKRHLPRWNLSTMVLRYLQSEFFSPFYGHLCSLSPDLFHFGHFKI